MNEKIIVFSQQQLDRDTPESVFKQIQSWRESLDTGEFDLVLELPIQRIGQSGWITDNPPIEEIDRMMHHASECGCRFGSILLPVNLKQSEENIGNEISSLDGWADLASYAEIKLARIRVLNMNYRTKPRIQEMFDEIIDYITEMDVAVSISSLDSNTPAQSSLLDSIRQNPDRVCGMEMQVDSNRVISLPDMDIPPIALSIPVKKSSSIQTIQSVFDETAGLYGESVQAIVFEME